MFDFFFERALFFGVLKHVRQARAALGRDTDAQTRDRHIGTAHQRAHVFGGGIGQRDQLLLRFGHRRLSKMSKT